MCTTSLGLRPLVLPDLFTRWIVGLFVALSLAMAGMAAHAAPPAANTKIVNAASASYSDASGTPYTVISNTVETVVQQVASLTLVANGAQNANPGGVVNYPHTLTNTGNGSDTFNLTTGNAGLFAMSGVQIFADNGSGSPTGPAITSPVTVVAGASFKFIVQGTVPAGATATQTNTITVTATSGFGASPPTASNTDVTTVTTNAIVTLSKSASVSSGPAGTAITYTLTYQNIGNVAATSVAITDILPAGLTYTPGTLRWSTTGSTALSDGGASTGTAPNTVTSGYTLGTKTLLVTLNQVIAGQSGTISFDVAVAPGTPPGPLNNTATMSYNDGVTTVTGVTSNTTSFNVSQTASLTLTGATVASAAAGTTVSFTNTVTNTGNGSDTFNITLSPGNFPAGTVFYLFKSDGVTPLTPTNVGDGVADTGPMAAGASYNVIVKAVLPAGATNAGAPFIVAVTATSVYDPTKSATANDELTAVSAASVDLINDSLTGLGQGVNPSGEATAQVTKSLDPGTSTTFTVVVKNTGASFDSYDLGVSTASSFPGALPAGWTISFLKDGGAGNCSATTGGPIASIGPVAAGANAVVCAVVSVPSGFAAGTVQLYFRALSPNSGASDVLHDAATVNALRSITLTPNGSGQVSANGSIVYKHTLTNSGNVTEGNGALSTVTLAASNSQATGWTSSLFLDNNNGTLDAGVDQPITGDLASVLPAGLAPGASVTIFNKVTVTGGAPGATNTTTITATTSQGTYATAAPGVATAIDNTTVVAGNLTLVKMQALDANCDGTPETGYAQAALNAKPNECVLYQVTVANAGNVDATSVVVNDSVPSYTTLSSGPATTLGTVAVTGTAISAAIGTLTPSTVPATNTAVVTFGVRITP